MILVNHFTINRKLQFTNIQPPFHQYHLEHCLNIQKYLLNPSVYADRNSFEWIPNKSMKSYLTKTHAHILYYPVFSLKPCLNCELAITSVYLYTYVIVPVSLLFLNFSHFGSCTHPIQKPQPPSETAFIQNMFIVIWCINCYIIENNQSPNLLI